MEHGDKMADLLAYAYPWVKSFHVVSVIAWMAGLFYLPRLFVYHTEQTDGSARMDGVFQTMETKLLRLIMNPAMISTWLFGFLLLSTPGIVDWGQPWPWIKAAGVIALTWFHMWCAARRREFAEGRNTRTGRTYRMMNEVPTLLLIVIVIAVIVRPF